MKDNTTNKKHSIFDWFKDHPILFTIILPIIYLTLFRALSTYILRPLGLSDIMVDIIDISITLIILIVFRSYCKDSLPKEHASVMDLIKGVFLGWPLLLFGFFSVFTGIMTSIEEYGHLSVSLPWDYLLASLVMSLDAGITEEVFFRGIPFSNLARGKREQKDIVICFILSSLVFGGTHLTNLFYGADLSPTIAQVAGAFGSGLLFAAIYFRSGSILPCIIVHTLLDFLGSVGAGMFSGANVSTLGVMAGSSDILLDIIRGAAQLAIYGGIALFYIRKKKRDEIKIHSL